MIVMTGIDPFKSRYITAIKNARIRSEVVALCTQRSIPINVAVISTIAVLYGGGMVLITRPQPWLAAAGVVVLLSAMLLAWYLSHDCAHHLVFRGKRSNHALGELLSWINGVGYFRFDEYCKYHIQHHTKQVDFIGVDINAALATMPRWAARCLIMLEAAYIPAMYGFIKLVAIVAVLRGPDRWYRVRTAAMIVITVGFFAGLAWSGIAAVVCYLLVVALRVHCVRFVDAFQHSYTQIAADHATSPKGKQYEQHHTFSFPVARRFSALNLLILNFGYHNAHHALPSCPWYNLPAVDALVASSTAASGAAPDPAASPIVRLRFTELLRGYHRHRTYRITTTDEGNAYDDALQFSMTNFTGAFTDNLLG